MQNEQENVDTNVSTSALVNALEAFANAPTFEITHRILVEQQTILLSPLALTTIQLMIDDLFANKQNAEAENWRQYLHILHLATTDGIENAWNYFITQQRNAKQALEALTTTSTMTELFQTIRGYQHILLTDAAIVMLRETIQRQYAHAPREALDYWHSLLRLLEDIREQGLTAAWHAFEEQQQS